MAEYSSDYGCTILPMLNPNQVVSYPQHRPSFAADFATLGRLIDHNYNIGDASRAVTGDYAYIDDLGFLIEQAPEVIAFD